MDSTFEMLIKQYIRSRLSLKRNSLPLLGKQSIVILLGRALTVAGSIIAIRVITEIVPPSEYGRLALALGIIALPSLAIYGSISKATARNLWDYYKLGQGGELVSASALFYLLIGIFLTCLYLVVRSIGYHATLAPAYDWWALSAFLLATALIALFLGVLNILQHQGWFVFFSILQSWLVPAMAIGLVIILGGTAENVIVGNIIGYALILAVLIWRIRSIHMLSPVPALSCLKKIWVELLSYSTPFFIALIFYWLQRVANRYVLDVYLPVDQVGLFVIAVNVANQLIIVIETIFTQIYVPRLYERISQRVEEPEWANIASQAMKEYFVIGVKMITPVFVLTFVGAADIMGLLVNKAYKAGVVVVAGAAFAEMLRVIGGISSQVFEVGKRPKHLIMPVAIAACAGLLVTILLTPLFGIRGAMWGLITSSGIIMVLNLLQAKRHLDFFRLPLLKIFQAVLWSVVIGGGARIAANLFVQQPGILRSTVLLGLFGLFYYVYIGREFSV